MATILVHITLTPLDLIKKTNADGIASFEIDTGDYFVVADVCWIVVTV